MKIGQREIGPGNPAYIVAEISCNHVGSLALAKRLIRAAKDAGADAVKFQAYRPSCLTADSDHPGYVLEGGPWSGRRLWDLYMETQTPFEWFPELVAECKTVGIDWFASVFSEDGLAMLEALDCPAYKIASAEVADLDFVRKVAETGRSVILSDGMTTVGEMHGVFQRSVFEAQDTQPGDYADAIVLRCVSEYPAKPATYALGDYAFTRCFSQTPWGISDHTLGNELAVAATALGACMFEKHLMLPEDDYAGDEWPADANHSLHPDQFARYIRAIRTTEAMLANTDRKISGSQWKRRLVFARDLPAGHVVTREDLVVKRCGQGLTPDKLTEIVGVTLHYGATGGWPVPDTKDRFRQLIAEIETAARTDA